MNLDIEELRKSASPDLIARNPGVFGPVAHTAEQRPHKSQGAGSNPAGPTTAKDFENEVIRWLRSEGWRVAHFRAGLTRSGKWVTAVSGDSEGFPDNFAVKGKTAITIECKTGSGKASPAQVTWLLALERAGIRSFIAHPDNWEELKIKIQKVEK